MQNAPAEHSALLFTCIKQSHGFKTFVLSILSGLLRQVSLYKHIHTVNHLIFATSKFGDIKE